MTQGPTAEDTAGSAIDGPLAGRVAIVTGGGQGVGRGIALSLAKAGARVVLTGRTQSKLDETVAEIEALGGTAAGVVADIEKPEDTARAVEWADHEYGGVDILVNNASLNPLGPLLKLDPAELDRAYRAVPLSALRAMQAVHPIMVRRGGGAIVNLVTSAAVRWDTSGYGGYASVKEALRSLTRTAASEWGKDAIRVNAVAPHALSPGLKWWTEAHPEEAAAFIATIPMGRIGDPETDIGRAVAWLVGPDACYLTGATIPLDGGQARWA